MKIENFNISYQKKKPKIKIFTLNNLLFLFFIYFSYFAINGSNGLLNLMKMNNKLDGLKKELSILQKEENGLQIKNNGLYIKSLDLDLLEEESKKSLGYVDASEVVILTENE